MWPVPLYYLLNSNIPCTVNTVSDFKIGEKDQPEGNY